MNENNPANSSIDPSLPVLDRNCLDWAWVGLDAGWRAPVKDILLHCFKVTLSGKIYLKQWRPWTSLSHICYKIVQLQQQVPCSWGEQWAFTFTTWISPAPLENNLLMKHIWYETTWYWPILLFAFKTLSIHVFIKIIIGLHFPTPHFHSEESQFSFKECVIVAY